MTLLRGNKEEKNMRREVKVEKNNRQTNKYGDLEHLVRLTECELVRNSRIDILHLSSTKWCALRPVLND